MKNAPSIHFIGLCGAGMSACARLYQQAGWQVTGSDQGMYDPIKDYLERLGLTCHTPHDPAHLPKDPQVIVIGRHAKLTKETCPEVAVAFEKFPERITSLPEALQNIAGQAKQLLVCGSYGKSTTATLVTAILQAANLHPGYFIGALPIDFDYTSDLGTGQVMVIEGDEYPSSNTDDRSKFLHLNPEAVLITALEHDHINVFPTQQSYLDPYRRLLQNLPKGATVIGCIDNPFVKEVLDSQTQLQPIYYSLVDQTAWHPRAIVRGEETSFDLYHGSEKICTLKTEMIGDHNIQNIVGAAAYVHTLGLADTAAIAAGVAACKGVTRRLDKKTKNSKLPVYEGFGSSYTKAKTAIDGLLQYFPDKNLTVVFEPHTFSWRNRASLQWYETVFEGVGQVLLYKPPTHGKAQHDQLSHDEIIAQAGRFHNQIHKVHSILEINQRLGKLDPEKDLVLLLSSGSFDGGLTAMVNFVEEKFS
ncbi:MAG: Mur ligase family protein [Bacteroidota bacterium]